MSNRVSERPRETNSRPPMVSETGSALEEGIVGSGTSTPGEFASSAVTDVSSNHRNGTAADSSAVTSADGSNDKNNAGNKTGNNKDNGADKAMSGE